MKRKKNKLYNVSHSRILANGGFGEGLDWNMLNNNLSNMMGNQGNQNSGSFGQKELSTITNAIAGMNAASSAHSGNNPSILTMYNDNNQSGGWGSEKGKYGMIGQSVDATGQMLMTIDNLLTKKRPPLEKTIGLYANGGNLFALGGNEIGNLATTTMQLAGNAIQNAQIADTSGIKEQISKTGNNIVQGNNYDDLMSEWNKRQELNHITARDLRNKSLFGDFANSLSASGKGFAAGSSFGPWGAVAGGVTGGVSSVVGSLFGRSKAKKEANRINQMVDAANVNNLASFTNAFDNATTDMNANVMRNFSAYGGPINIAPNKKGTFTAQATKMGMGVQEAARHILANKDNYSTAMIRKANFARNAANWNAFGGELSTHGGDFNQLGNFTFINNGGTHEQNPYQGVPMGTDQNGTPNLVEQGETIFNDYVFSNRLKVPEALIKKYNLKKNSTYADASKQLAKESENRPNDKISNDTLGIFMNELQNSQEELKAKRERAKQLRQFNKLSPDEKLGLMQMAQANAAPIGEDNMQPQQEVSQEIPQDMQGYALGGNLFDDGGDVIINQSNKEDVINGLLALKNRNQNNSPNPFNTYYNVAQTYTPIQNYDFDNMWDKAKISKFNNSNLSENLPYDTKNLINFSKNNISVHNLSDFENSKHYKDFTAYAKTLPETHIYWKTLAEKTGKDVKWLRKNYDSLRTDGKFGFVHLTPILKETTPISTGKAYSYDTLPRDIAPAPLNFIEDNIEDNTKTKKTGEKDDKNSNKNSWETWLRYAPVLGSAIGLASNIFSRPDESSANAILNAAKEAGRYTPVSFNPISNYLQYNPFDRDYYINKLNAQAGATRRNIINQSNANRSQAIAGLLAADYNAQTQLGDLARKAEEYNLAQRQQVETFNRGTNQFNSEGIFKADTANQVAQLQARSYMLNGTLQAERLRQAAKAQLAAERSANLTNLFNSLGNIGREAYTRNLLNSSRAYTDTLNGIGNFEYKKDRKQKYGGKLNRKRGK